MDPLEISNLYKLTDKISRRISSWDKSGRNRDFIQLKGKKTEVLADIEGPGIIKHVYFTMLLQNPLDFRRAVIKIYWDNEENPSVEVPFGDLFLIGNCRIREMMNFEIP